MSTLSLVKHSRKTIGKGTRTVEYDAVGRLVYEKDEEGNDITSTKDEKGEPVAVQPSLVSAGVLTTDEDALTLATRINPSNPKQQIYDWVAEGFNADSFNQASDEFAPFYGQFPTCSNAEGRAALRQSVRGMQKMFPSMKLEDLIQVLSLNVEGASA